MQVPRQDLWTGSTTVYTWHSTCQMQEGPLEELGVWSYLLQFLIIRESENLRYDVVKACEIRVVGSILGLRAPVDFYLNDPVGFFKRRSRFVGASKALPSSSELVRRPAGDAEKLRNVHFLRPSSEH